MFGWRNWQTRAVEGRIVASSNLAPNTKFDARQARSPTRQRQHAQTVSSVGSNPTEPTKAPVVQLVETAALKAAQCRFESGQAHQMPRLPMVRRADSKPAIGCSNHPWGAMRRNSKWRAAELQPRRARFDSAAALQEFVCGGVDELLKSPVPKTGVSP